jgi:hypothetical protein
MSNSKLETIRDGSVSDYRLEMKTALKIEKSLTSLALHLSHCLFHGNEEIQLETARVMGNLSRRPGPIKSLINCRSEEALMMLLSHSNAEIVSAAAGTLVNISSDSKEGRNALLKESTGSFATLTTLLRRLSLKNIPLSTLICQVCSSSVYSLRHPLTYLIDCLQPSLVC